MTTRRTAAEIIAFHLGWDMPDVSETRYQPTRLANPAIYTPFSEGYIAAPSNNLPPTNLKGDWKVIGEHYGRKVFEMIPRKEA